MNFMFYDSSGKVIGKSRIKDGIITCSQKVDVVVMKLHTTNIHKTAFKNKRFVQI